MARGPRGTREDTRPTADSELEKLRFWRPATVPDRVGAVSFPYLITFRVDGDDSWLRSMIRGSAREVPAGIQRVVGRGFV